VIFIVLIENMLDDEIIMIYDNQDIVLLTTINQINVII